MPHWLIIDLEATTEEGGWPLEEMEMLEQLRALENGVAIHVVHVENVVTIAIDTPHDLERAQEYLNEQ